MHRERVHVPAKRTPSGKIKREAYTYERRRHNRK